MGGEANIEERVVVERRVKTGEVVLRFAMLVLAIVCAERVGSDTETRNVFSIAKTAKFTDMKALVFLLVVNAIVASYSFVQGLRCVLTIYIGCPLLSKPVAWLIFGFDQTMAYLSVAAAAAAAESAYVAERGQIEFQWIKVCDFFGKFCTQVGEGLVTAFLGSLCMITVSGISAYHLFRLYDIKGKSIE